MFILFWNHQSLHSLRIQLPQEGHWPPRPTKAGRVTRSEVLTPPKQCMRARSSPNPRQSHLIVATQHILCLNNSSVPKVSVPRRLPCFGCSRKLPLRPLCPAQRLIALPLQRGDLVLLHIHLAGSRGWWGRGSSHPVSSAAVLQHPPKLMGRRAPPHLSPHLHLQIVDAGAPGLPVRLSTGRQLRLHRAHLRTAHEVCLWRCVPPEGVPANPDG